MSTWPVGYQSPLLLEGWLEFNRYKWGVKPLKVRLTEDEKELPAIEAVLYLDKKGRIVHPPLNPYLPVVFYPTPTDKVTRLYRQWATVSAFLAEEFIRRGVRGSVALPPEVVDVRQWQWRGFLAEVRYTFYLDLPHEMEAVDPAARAKANKAIREGFTCETATKDTFAEVMSCLGETEARQGFSHRLNEKDLRVALDLLGSDIFRVYICRSASGEVVCARIDLSAPGMRAVDWVAGTKAAFLHSGCTQLLIWHVLNDLAQQGATGFDFAGANLPTVSAVKADWGGRLTPHYVVRPFDLRTVGKTAIMMWQRIRKGI